MSQCSCCSHKCLRSAPPAPCTMHLGTPVGPEENRMYSGWSNGSGAQGMSVAGFHAQGAQSLRDARDLLVQLAMREASLYLVFAPEHHRRGRVAPPQQVLGEVEPRLRIPARPRYPVAVHENPRALRARAHARELPQRFPELLRVLDRPAVEGRIVVQS